jgi:glycosyltransferase involved in cell wall biosynthesis
MFLRYLFGPVSGPFAEQNLHAQRRSGACLTFGPDGGADLTVRPGDSWDDVRGQLPDGWTPDFLALHLAYAFVPAGLWQAPLPRVALAADWNYLWHYYRGRLTRCDLVLTDSAGAEVLSREGISARAALLCGCDRLFVERAPQSAEQDKARGLRDIDVLFVGNLNPAVQRQRAAWLTRLARLGKRWRVQIRTGIFGEPYWRLLNRARIVFQFSARGKAGRRAFEAASAGALIFQEEGNREMPALFRDRQECIYYTADNLEELIEHYLQNEDERLALVEAARSRAASGRFEDLWQDQVDAIARDWPRLRDAAGRPDFGAGWPEFCTRAWQVLSCGRYEDAALLGQLERLCWGEAGHPDGAGAANLAGCLLWRQGWGRSPAGVLGEMAARLFRRALALQPDFALAGLNLAEALAAAGLPAAAGDAARQTLDILSRSPDLDSASAEGMPLCQPFDTLHVEWERAAWEAAGRPGLEARNKRNLILWKLHGLLAGQTGELPCYYEAALRRPDLPGSAAALGAALVRAERREAREHLGRALADNPFDRESAHALLQLLAAGSDVEARQRLGEDRRLLARAAVQALPSEPWFAEPRPRGNELVSIIALCDDRLDEVRPCLEAIFNHTRAPWELLLVEKGSSRESRAHLEEVRKRRGPARVELIRNTAPPGFAKGCNQALAKARGRFVVFLDAAVPAAGWLDCLVALALHDWPAVGMVGPVTHFAPPPQGLQVEPADFDAFAAQCRRTHPGELLQVNRLSGFCLLSRRELLDRVGGFDERFTGADAAAGDLGLRMLEAGLRLLVAQDAFVVHRAAVEQAVSETDLPVLEWKWGSEIAAAFRTPPAPPAEETPLAKPLPSGSLEGPAKPGVSLCMIVRNEENNLPDCLRSVEGLFSEIIVVDTGSTDATREVARRFGAQLLEFPWVDSFAAARNESIEHASCKWIMWLDADDRLDEENRARLRAVFAGLCDERDAYAIQVRSVLDAGRTAFRLLDQVRIFRNLPEVRWDYRIHEQILPAVNRAGGAVRWTDVIVDHVGYQEMDLRKRKLERNLRLLEMDHVERSDDSFSLFNLGWTLLDLGRLAEAMPALQRSLETARPDSSILRKLYHLLGVAHRQLSAGDEALRACREGLKRFPDDAELLLEEGLMLRDKGDLAGAEHSWLRLFEPRQGKYFSSEDMGLRGFRSRQLLAELFAAQQRWVEAEFHWRSALEERGDFEPAWQGLAELYLRQGRWPDLEELLQKLDQQGVAAHKVGWLRARGQLQRKEFAAARNTLSGLIEQDPQALGPRVLLSQALLQEGRDWQAAEKALLDVLALDDKNQDAQHNLQILRRQKRSALAPASVS